MARVQNNLAAIRKARGVGAAELAKKVGVTRQTIYAIEAGNYVPNTEVTMAVPAPPVPFLLRLTDGRTWSAP